MVEEISSKEGEKYLIPSRLLKLLQQLTFWSSKHEETACIHLLSHTVLGSLLPSMHVKSDLAIQQCGLLILDWVIIA